MIRFAVVMGGVVMLGESCNADAICGGRDGFANIIQEERRSVSSRVMTMRVANACKLVGFTCLLCVCLCG